MGHVQSSWLEYFMKYKDFDGLSMQKRDCDWCGKSFKHSTHIHCSSKCFNEASEQHLKSMRTGGTWLTDKLTDLFVIFFSFLVAFSYSDNLFVEILFTLIFFMCCLRFVGLLPDFGKPKR